MLLKNHSSPRWKDIELCQLCPSALVARPQFPFLKCQSSTVGIHWAFRKLLSSFCTEQGHALLIILAWDFFMMYCVLGAMWDYLLHKKTLCEGNNVSDIHALVPHWHVESSILWFFWMRFKSIGGRSIRNYRLPLALCGTKFVLDMRI